MPLFAEIGQTARAIRFAHAVVAADLGVGLHEVVFASMVDISGSGSVGGRVMPVPPISRVVTIAAAAAMGGFLFGFDTAVINGAVGAIGTWSGVGSLQLGFSVASALLGCAVGAWFAGPISAKLGRISVMKLAALLFFVTSLACGLVWDIWSLTIFRLIGGLAVGAASVIAPAYIAEVSPASVRGRLGSMQQLAIVLGIFVSLLSNYALAQAAGGAANELWLGLEAWRWMFMAECVPALIYGVLAFTIPESPRFLIGKGRLEEAAQILTQYGRSSPNTWADPSTRRSPRSSRRCPPSPARRRRCCVAPTESCSRSCSSASRWRSCSSSSAST